MREKQLRERALMLRDKIRTWLQFPGQDSILNLVCQLNHRINFLAALLPFLEQLFKLFVHRVLAAEESVDFILLDWETSLDGLLASPVLPVCLSFDEDLNSC